jgi:hypothetical protein
MGKKNEVGRLARRALKNGEINRLPCWTCDAPETDMHHADYSAPLSVVFLCRKCHNQCHTVVRVWERNQRRRRAESLRL